MDTVSRSERRRQTSRLGHTDSENTFPRADTEWSGSIGHHGVACSPADGPDEPDNDQGESPLAGEGEGLAMQNYETLASC